MEEMEAQYHISGYEIWKMGRFRMTVDSVDCDIQIRSFRENEFKQGSGKRSEVSLLHIFRDPSNLHIIAS